MENREWAKRDYDGRVIDYGPRPKLKTKLRRLRLNLDITQAEMAARMNISRARYSILENGRGITLGFAKKVAEVTGQSVGEVIDDYYRMEKLRRGL